MLLSEARTKLEELKAVAEPTDDQKNELSSIETFVKEEETAITRLQDLKKKDENLLTSEEVDELLQLSEKYSAEDIKEPEPVEKKKYAGIYETPEALLDGLLSSETERKRISEELKKDPELSKQVEELYKDSQRKVTKVVEIKNKGSKTAKGLSERKLSEMTKEEYEKWEKENKLEANAWLIKAQSLNEAQAKSGRTVLKKHPEFLAMMQGIVDPSEEFKKFQEVEAAHPDWEHEPNQAELILEEAEKSFKKPSAPKKEVEKPDLGNASGKAKATPSYGKKLSVEEFEALTPEQQREYMEKDVLS